MEVPMPTLRELLRLGAATVALAACTAASPAATGTPVPVIPSEPAPASVAPTLKPFDHGEIPAELVGRYAFQAFDHYLQDRWVDLNADGTFALIDGPLVYGQGTTIVTGQYGVFGDQIRFGNEVSVTGVPCGRDGLYQWSLDGTTLTMTVIEDPCTLGRPADWQAGWTKEE
jgi:hypothetical protein